MELQKPKEWVSSLDLTTILIVTLSVITIVFSVILARSSNSNPIAALFGR